MVVLPYDLFVPYSTKPMACSSSVQVTSAVVSVSFVTATSRKAGGVVSAAAVGVGAGVGAAGVGAVVGAGVGAEGSVVVAGRVVKVASRETVRLPERSTLTTA